MGGPTTTTKSTQDQNTQQQQTQQNQGFTGGTSTVTPNMPSWYQNFLQGMPQQFQGVQQKLQQQTQTPLYGAPQQANFQQQLNQNLGAAGNNIASKLASTGALNSNRYGQALTGLNTAGVQQMQDYLAKTPLLNAQFQQSALGQLANNTANMGNFKIPIGQTTTQQQIQDLVQQLSGSSQTQASSDTTQQTSGGLMQSLLGGLLGAGMSALTGGLSNLINGGGGQGGGGGAPTQSVTPALLPTDPFSAMQAPPSLGAQPVSYGAPGAGFFGLSGGPSWG